MKNEQGRTGKVTTQGKFYKWNKMHQSALFLHPLPTHLIPASFLYTPTETFTGRGLCVRHPSRDMELGGGNVQSGRKTGGLPLGITANVRWSQPDILGFRGSGPGRGPCTGAADQVGPCEDQG